MKTNKTSNSNQSNWLTTYADMVTLLLTFFIMLYAISSVDAQKWNSVVNAFNKDSILEDIIDAQGTGGGNTMEDLEAGQDDFDSLYYILKDYIEKNNLQDSIEVHKGDDYNFIIFKNNVFFNGDSTVLRSDGKEILNYLCDGMKNISASIGEIRILGHTAQAKINEANNPEIDRTFSTERANAVLLYIQGKNIIDPAKLISVGYGQHRPLNDNSTETLRMENRRVEILVSKHSGIDDKLDEIYNNMKNNTI